MSLVLITSQHAGLETVGLDMTVAPIDGGGLLFTSSPSGRPPPPPPGRPPPPHRRVSLSPTRQGSRQTSTDTPAPSTRRSSTQQPSTRWRRDLHPAELHSTRRRGALPQWRGAIPRCGAPPGSVLHLCGDGDGSKARGRA
jgi:hypothetical protein